MSTWTGEIEPADLEQIRIGANGKMHVITDDAGGVAKGLHAIDPRLRLRYSEAGDYYVVYCREPNEPEGSGWMVATYQECDQRIVKDVEHTYWKWRQPGFSFADELEKLDAEKKKAQQDAFEQHIGESAEELAWALRGDMGINNHRAFISEGIPSGED